MVATKAFCHKNQTKIATFLTVFSNKLVKNQAKIAAHLQRGHNLGFQPPGVFLASFSSTWKIALHIFCNTANHLYSWSHPYMDCPGGREEGGMGGRGGEGIEGGAKNCLNLKTLPNFNINYTKTFENQYLNFWLRAYQTMFSELLFDIFFMESESCSAQISMRKC